MCGRIEAMSRWSSFFVVFTFVLSFAQSAHAAGVFYTNPILSQQCGGTSCGNGQTRVLQGIPAIARAFAPVTGVKWQDFANVLAGICAVESQCNPTYPHYVRNSSGAQVYSQYQGLFQMNPYEMAKAQASLQQMLPKMEAAAASDPEQKKAYEFVVKAIEAARGMSGGDLRFHPEYGIILGAAKHITTNAKLTAQYPGDPIRQAAGHLTAQFSGITEAKIKNGQFNAPITGVEGDVRTERGALAVNRVGGASDVAGAIESAGATYAAKMRAMMVRMSQVTNGLTSIPEGIQPFTVPPYQPGTTPVLDGSYNGVTTLMESGYMRPVPAPPFAPSAPPQTTSLSPTTIGTPAAPVNSTQIGQTTQMGQQAAPVGNVTTQLPVTANTTQTGSSGTAAKTPNPAAILVVQPQTVLRGNPLLVAWATVGMKIDRECVLTQNGVYKIGEGNQGSVVVSTKQPQTGIIFFQIDCVTQSGQSLERSTSATIR